MSAEGLVLVITAVSVQLLTPLLTHLRMQKTVGSPNGLGTLHEGIRAVADKVDALGERVARLEERP